MGRAGFLAMAGFCGLTLLHLEPSQAFLTSTRPLIRPSGRTSSQALLAATTGKLSKIENLKVGRHHSHAYA